ncbi:MAG TPA: DnaB-like helicase C-terminal domain-containing protein [Bacteroidales bacterium]|nr:DnaB-like helicase C-terminal domain-containing protein [Bacteroidales bacterium]
MIKFQKIDKFLTKKKLSWDLCNERQKEILLKENENVWDMYTWNISDNVERKFIETFNIEDWEIETDTGWEDISAIGKTIEYEKWYLITEHCYIECADEHIVFDENFNEVFVKDLKINDLIQTKNGKEKVVSVYTNGEYEHMYDIEVNSKNHRYYTDNILSHNSIWLANLAANAVKMGYNSAVISLEMRDRHVVKRLGANMLGITMQDYAKLAEDQDMIRKKLSNIGYEDLKQPGKLWIKEYPTSSASVKDVERWLLKMEQIKGIKFKTVFIDYINILMNWRNPNSENMYLKIKQIAEDMRAMGTRNNWSIITLTQINRQGFGASGSLSLTNIAESSGLGHTVDWMGGIIQDELMYAENEYILQTMLNRNEGYKNSRKKFNIDYSHMRITEDMNSQIILDTING